MGQVLGTSPGKIGEHSAVILANANGPLAYASTNQFGEFHLEIDSENDLAVRIRVEPNVWIETPLREIAGLR
jgi:hypothetical protein